MNSDPVNVNRKLSANMLPHTRGESDESENPITRERGICDGGLGMKNSNARSSIQRRFGSRQSRNAARGMADRSRSEGSTFPIDCASISSFLPMES